MKNITFKNGFLSIPVLVAGTKHTIGIDSESVLDGARIHLILVDRETQTVSAVSPQLDIDNNFTADIDLFTDTVYSVFTGTFISSRRWLNAELIDIEHRQSVASGTSVMRNSALITGTGASVPAVSTILSTADFSGISDAIPTTPNQTTALLLEILAALKGNS